MSEDFSMALLFIRTGRPMRRAAWRPGKEIRLRKGTQDSMSYLEIVYTDGTGRRAPWTPTRCDLLEQDWEPSPC